MLLKNYNGIFIIDFAYWTDKLCSKIRSRKCLEYLLPSRVHNLFIFFRSMIQVIALYFGICANSQNIPFWISFNTVRIEPGTFCMENKRVTTGIHNCSYGIYG